MGKIKHYFKEQDKIVGILKVLFPKATIYLFGSRARGNHTERSDVDLAVRTTEKLSSLDIDTAKEAVSAIIIPQSIDVVNFKNLPENLKETILDEGIIL